MLSGTNNEEITRVITNRGGVGSGENIRSKIKELINSAAIDYV